MPIIHALTETNYGPTPDGGYDKIELAEYVAKLRAGGATVELFEGEQKLYSCNSSTAAIGLVKTYVGAVLATGEKNWHDDSDFYAIVWDESEQRMKNVEYDTTRFGGGGSAVIDATPEVMAKADDYLEKWALGVLTAEDRRVARDVVIGKRVRVVQGRKAPIGTEGLVFFAKEWRYAKWDYSPKLKIGIALTDEKIVGPKGGQMYKDVSWTYAHNVEVIEPEQYHEAEESLREKAKRFRGHYRAETMYYSAKAGMLVA